jgi:uncharacterized caspase-like protein
MLRRFCLLAILMGLVCAAARSAEGERYALLVGVSDYPEITGLKKLKYAESDMKALKQALVEIGYKERNIRLLPAGGDARFAPTRTNIERELKLLLDGKGADDAVIVAVAGHGLQMRKDARAYFCPIDSDVEKPETWMDLENVFAQLKECGAGGKLLIADCCRNDPKLEGFRDTQKVESVTRPEMLKPPQSVAALYSCRNGERAFEEEDATEDIHGGSLRIFDRRITGGAAKNGKWNSRSWRSICGRMCTIM